MAASAEIVGLIPAAGQARRLAPLPCSKEVFPVGFEPVDAKGVGRPKPVCIFLLEKMAAAGAWKVYIVLRDGKWDIPSYLGDGSRYGLSLAYLMMRLPYGPPYTLDQAYPFVGESTVLFGFPDILLSVVNPYLPMLACQRRTGADVVLGTMPAVDPRSVDMIDASPDGRVNALVRNPASTSLERTWLVAVWASAFTNFLHEHLQTLDPGLRPGEDLAVGDVFQAAIEKGMLIQSVHFPEARYLDIGTPESLAQAVCEGSDPSNFSFSPVTSAAGNR